MAIRLVEDVLVPSVVPAVDYVSEKFPSTEPGKYSDYIGLALCAGGYGLNMAGIGGNMSKNIGIASLNWAVNAVRKLAGGAGVSRNVSGSRFQMRPAGKVAGNVTRYPAQPKEYGQPWPTVI